MNNHHEPKTVMSDCADVIRSFRAACEAAGFEEERRVRVVSTHDASVRFTNSTISVLKPRFSTSAADEPVFLVQPAVRLRNLQHVRASESMSAFGCTFMALGALVSPDCGARLAAAAAEFFVSMGTPPSSLSWWVGPEDDDLAKFGKTAGFRVIRDQDGGPYRHVFGMPDRLGRNANFHVGEGPTLRPVGNFISIETPDGDLVGFELAFGVNALVAQSLELEHTALAGPAISALDFGFVDLIAIDALHTSLTLAIDGLTPVSRGRGGNYRSLLHLLDSRTPDDIPVLDAAASVLRAEIEFRRLASLPRPGAADPDVDETLLRFQDHLSRVSHRRSSR